MHEMGIVLNVVDSASHLAKKFQVPRLGYVKIEVGELSGAFPRYLMELWPHGTQNTICEGAQLLVEEVKAVVSCSTCKQEYTIMEHLVNNFAVCPYCQGERYTVLKGKDITIIELGAPE